MGVRSGEYEGCGMEAGAGVWGGGKTEGWMQDASGIGVAGVVKDKEQEGTRIHAHTRKGTREWHSTHT